MKRLFSTLVALGMAWCAAAQTTPHQFEVNVKKLGAEIAPTMYGIFFEDVNFAADDLDADNSFDAPTKLVPQSKAISVEGAKVEMVIPAKSFAMYKIKN